MIIRVIATTALVASMGVLPATPVRADAGDVVGGLIVGGLIGAAIQADQQNRRNHTTTVRTTHPSIPATQMGSDTQTALNYFGFNAGSVDGQIGRGTRAAIERYQATMGYPVNGRDYPTYQYDQLMQAYYWAINGGSAQTGLYGQPLLIAYRDQQRALAAQPQTQVTSTAPQTIIVTPPQTGTVSTVATK